MATHGLVFILSGVKTRWKQIVAYHLSGSSFSGKAVADILLQIVRAADEIGLKVVNITSDMRSCNQGM